MRELILSRKGFSGANDDKILKTLMSLPEYRKASDVFVYIGVGEEIKTEAIIDDMLDSGKNVYVPLCFGNGEMTAKKIQSREELHPGRYGIPEPLDDADEIDAQELSLIIVPGVAFGRDFSRLGRGGGYYDRFLEKAKNAVFIAPCREQNLEERLPKDEHDRDVDIIVTEEKVLRKVR